MDQLFRYGIYSDGVNGPWQSIGLPTMTKAPNPSSDSRQKAATHVNNFLCCIQAEFDQTTDIRPKANDFLTVAAAVEACSQIDATI